jgi:integrase
LEVKHGEVPELWALAIGEWLKDARRTRHWSDQTRVTRRQHLETAARSLGGSPWDVDDDELAEWFSRQAWRRETRRTHTASHRAFWAWAVRAGHLEVSPAEVLPSVKPGPPHPNPLPELPYRSALRTARPRERLMVRLAGEMGLRRGEVAQVHTDDVVRDLVGWTLVVHGKGDKDRLVPLPDDLADELRHRPRGWVFPGRDHGHLSPRYVGTIVKRLLPPGFTMHTLRAKFGTDAHEVDHDIMVVKELLGHANVATTQAYVLVNRQRLRSTVEAVSSARRAPGPGVRQAQ